MTGRAGHRKVHRTARLNYAPRAVSFVAVFLAILLLAAERGLGTVALLLAVASFLVYPHLAYLHARFARDSRIAEQINLIIDSALLGVWVAAMGFNLWFGYALFVATVLNSAVIGGPWHLLRSAATFAVAAMGWTVLFGFDFQPYSSLGFSLFVAAFSAAYVLSVGIIFYRQHKQLVDAHKTIARNNRVFCSLLELEVLSSDSESVANLTDKALDHFHEENPDLPFGLLLFSRKRPKQLIHAGFRGIEEPWQDRIVQELASSGSNGLAPAFPLEFENGPTLLVIPMRHHLDHATGFLVMSEQLAAALAGVLDLFVNRLASSLQNKLLNEELQKAADTDGLTGLFNRAFLERQLAAAIDLKRRHASVDFSVIMLDVIGLKQTNDTLGHEAGDQLISTIASRLKAEARETDVVARFGGDEFVVLCNGCREAETLRVVERMLPACRSEPVPICLVDGQRSRIPVEISVGAAGSDRHEPERVMPAADARMYADKQAYYERQQESR